MQTMRTTLWIAALCLVSLLARGADSDAFKRVASARYFAFGGIGFAGITSEEELAFREIMASKSAGVDLLRLLKVGNGEGKCYALVGLRLKDRAAFEEQAKTLANLRKEVETVGGCLVTKQSLSAVVARIQAGAYDQWIQPDVKRPKNP
jgi:hypothetical protein